MAASSRSINRWMLFLLGFALGTAILFGWPWLRAITQSNLETPGNAPVSVYLDADDVLDSLFAKMQAAGARFREADARRVAGLMEYGPRVKPGHYRIAPGQTSREWMVPLRLGRQDPINLTFTKFRTIEALSAHMGERLSFDSTAMANLLSDPTLLAAHGLRPETALAAFLANTYSVWWYTTPEAFLERMLSERERFWNSKGRTARADSLGLSTWEVQTLASIVMEEQAALPVEWPRIAGLYLNRIEEGMRLESDPTIKFALGNFEARRVTFPMIDACADSPWNTYRQDGIPPGPLCTVSPKAVDAVLFAEDHPFLFMCAKADFSGYHAFARTNREHNINRARFIAEQNRRGIR